MKKLFSRLFSFTRKVATTIPPKTVDEVLSTFNDTIKDLKAAGEHHGNLCSHHRNEEDIHGALAALHRSEADRASLVAQRLENLLKG